MSYLGVPIKINYKVGKLLDKKLLKSLSRTKKDQFLEQNLFQEEEQEKYQIILRLRVKRNNLRINKRNTLSI